VTGGLLAACPSAVFLAELFGAGEHGTSELDTAGSDTAGDGKKPLSPSPGRSDSPTLSKLVIVDMELAIVDCDV
jgi:hypothetical protein